MIGFEMDWWESGMTSFGLLWVVGAFLLQFLKFQHLPKRHWSRHRFSSSRRPTAERLGPFRSAIKSTEEALVFGVFGVCVVFLRLFRTRSHSQPLDAFINVLVQELQGVDLPGGHSWRVPGGFREMNTARRKESLCGLAVVWDGFILHLVFNCQQVK